MRRKPQHARKHPLVRQCCRYGRLAGYGAVATGVAVVMPSTAFASPWHGDRQPTHQNPSPPVLVFTTATFTTRCGDEPNPTLLQETTTTANTNSGVIGIVTITAPSGRTLRFAENYQNTIPVGTTEVTDVTGWAILGPGAIGNDIIYLEGGTAAVNHYGVPFLISGRSLDVCKALGV